MCQHFVWTTSSKPKVLYSLPVCGCCKIEGYVTQLLADLQEHHYNLLQYELRGQSVSLSNLFNKLEEAQKDLDVEDYSVSQNTLDNVSTMICMLIAVKC